MLGLVGTISLSSPEWINDGNPFGFHEGFRRSMDETWLGAFQNAQKLDIKHVLCWDLEGARGRDKAFYEGTPWNIQMSLGLARVRQWCKPFVDAGIKIGGTIRPQLYCRGMSGPTQQFNNSAFEVLASKVSFAKEALNWTVYYVDVPTTTPPDAGDWPILEASVFERLTKEFPDCVFVPEYGNTGYGKLNNVYPLTYFPSDKRAWTADEAAGTVIKMVPKTKLNALQRADLSRRLSNPNNSILCSLTWDEARTEVLDAWRKARRSVP